MVIVIDTDTDSLNYDQLVQLEGIEYLFRFLWAERESVWYLSIYDQNETPLALAICLVIEQNLLRSFLNDLLPPGLLYCADLSGQDQDIITSDELGQRVPLTYVTSDDEVFA